MASGLLQTGGAVAGGAGDLIDDALVNLPVVGKGYEWVTEKLGQALGGAANATGLTEWFGNQSPEVQRNIEAGLNVASVIPLFRALKYGKKGATDAFTTAK